MIVKLKENRSDYPDLTPDQPYFVIGIEADVYRLLNDHARATFWQTVNHHLSHAA